MKFSIKDLFSKCDQIHSFHFCEVVVTAWMTSSYQPWFVEEVKFLIEKVNHIGFLRKLISKENEYFFIDNGNIEIRDLRKDNVHLLE